MSDPHFGFDFGHYVALSDEFYINGAGYLYEKDNKSYLDRLFIDTDRSNMFWGGKLPFDNKIIKSNSAKVVEAFQVVFNK